MVQLLPLTTLLLTMAGLASAIHKKSCRQCDCTMTVYGPDRGDATKATIIAVMDGKMGGGDYSWTKDPLYDPKSASYVATLHVPRLCGNGGKYVHDWPYTWPGGVNTSNVNFDCKCDPSVKCLKGSRCERSGIK